ncbi:hypothetical protein FA13DRAFT_1815346 [Coprinellus micaceus]|uniref:Uncharacterized protein n=1 Tax=Coprinellus micaceus TaxID=71717 RepID=A0A4Y7T5F6_COPMI|nr:hypothetical protein FA13DRAFT_1815346 [Coprinellus micaceus]
MVSQSHWQSSTGAVVLPTVAIFAVMLVVMVASSIKSYHQAFAIDLPGKPIPQHAQGPPHPSMLFRLKRGLYRQLPGLSRLRWNPLESPLEQTRRLAQRDVIYMSFNKGSSRGHRNSNSHNPTPLYDALRGLLYLRLAELSTSREYTSLDDCMASVLDENATIPGYAEFILRLSCAIPLSYGVTHGVDDKEEPAVMGDEATLRLFSRNSTFDNLPFQVEPTGLEICMRLTGWTYGREEPLAYTQPNRPAVLDQSLPIEWVSHILENRKLDSGIVEDIRLQTGLILLEFFKRIKTFDCDATAADTTMDNNRYVGRFLESSAKVSACGETLEGLDIYDEILAVLRGDGGSLVFAWRAAVAFCRGVLGCHSGTVPPSFSTFVKALKKYHEDLGGLAKPITPHFDFEWDAFLASATARGIDFNTEDDGTELIQRLGATESPACAPPPPLRTSETEAQVEATASETQDRPPHVAVDVSTTDS